MVLRKKQSLSLERTRIMRQAVTIPGTMEFEKAENRSNVIKDVTNLLRQYEV